MKIIRVVVLAVVVPSLISLANCSAPPTQPVVARTTTSASPEEVPFQPLPEYQARLRAAKTYTSGDDRVTPDSMYWIWLGQEGPRTLLDTIKLESVRDILIPARNTQLTARIYTPTDKQLARDGKLPIIIFYHGGGWSIGSINTHDSITRELAAQTPAIVISVQYRLAPEYPFPVAYQDAYTAAQWIAMHATDFGGDPNRLAVAGDSAGGNLATVVAMIARDISAKGEFAFSIKFQTLFYPSVNLSDTSYPSYQQYGNGFGLTTKWIDAARDFYVPNKDDWKNPYASPLLAKDLSGMPRTLIVGAGCDPLRDEGKEYADRLSEAKVKVDYRIESRFIHGFLNDFNREPKSLSDQVKQIIDDSAAVMRDALR